MGAPLVPIKCDTCGKDLKLWGAYNTPFGNFDSIPCIYEAGKKEALYSLWTDDMQALEMSILPDPKPGDYKAIWEMLIEGIEEKFDTNQEDT